MSDHIHACISIPPRYGVANAIGFLKGKRAIRLHHEFGRRGEGMHFWIRGYNVNTVGLNEEQIYLELMWYTIETGESHNLNLGFMDDSFLGLSLSFQCLFKVATRKIIVWFYS